MTDEAPKSVEEDPIAWALWCTLMCFCVKCDARLELPDFRDPPWDGDVTAWAIAWEPLVRSQGWNAADDGFNLICPQCAAVSARETAG